MLPRYYLGSIEGGEVMGFDEWSDLLPLNHHATFVKPLFVSNSLPLINGGRSIDGMILRDIKTGPMGFLTESGLAEAVRRAGMSPEIDELTSLISVSRAAISRTWNAATWEKQRNLLPPEIRDLIERNIIELFDEADIESSERQLWVIGSLLYDDNFNLRRDVDITAALRPQSSARLRRAFAIRRLNDSSAVPESSPFPFAYRLKIGPIHVDFFPARPDDLHHPIANASSWRMLGMPRARTIRIENIEWSSYSLPLLQVSGTPSWVLICSNAFRGAFWPGQELTVRAVAVEIDNASNGMLQVDAVVDPWSNILDWNDFMSYGNDRRWLSKGT
jgi:hypothetical protein